jgi:hypothetical protein
MWKGRESGIGRYMTAKGNSGVSDFLRTPFHAGLHTEVQQRPAAVQCKFHAIVTQVLRTLKCFFHQQISNASELKVKIVPRCLRDVLGHGKAGF